MFETTISAIAAVIGIAISVFAGITFSDKYFNRYVDLIKQSIKTIDEATRLIAALMRRVKNDASMKRPPPNIVLAPGSHAVVILRLLFSKKAMDKVFMQVVADMRAEHAEALHAGQLRLAKWISIRGHVGLFFAALAYIGASFGKKVLMIWKLIV